MAKDGRERRRAQSSTRERLLQAADRLWSERGLQGASLEDIARDAAVTKPTLYYYFADKSGLFTETTGYSVVTRSLPAGRSRRMSARSTCKRRARSSTRTRAAKLVRARGKWPRTGARLRRCAPIRRRRSQTLRATA